MTSVKSSRTYTTPVPKMPPGLVELMEGLAKDVLKSNPPDVYSFCANHMKKLIEIRDGPTSTRVMTLDQKIDVAIKKIKIRAARRREDYDKKIQTYMQSGIQNNKEYENNAADCNDSEYVLHVSDAKEYDKDKIVTILDGHLAGDIEHEIVVDIKENSLKSEIENNSEKDMETTSAEIIPTNNDQPYNGKDNVKDYSLSNKIEDLYESKTILEIQENVTKEYAKNEIDINEIDSQVDGKIAKGLELVETKNSESPISIATLTKNESCVKRETSPHPENCENEPDLRKREDDSNRNLQKSNVFIVIDKPNNFNDLEKIEENATFDLKTTKTTCNDENTLCNSIASEEENASKGQIFPEERQAKTMSTTPSTEVDEILDTNNSELDIHANNTSMDLETAAITIQKVFRNFLFKNKTLSTDDPANVDINSMTEDKTEKDINDISSMSKDRRTLGLSRMDTVLQTVNEEKSLSQSTDDSSTLSSAATIIQAHVRGYLVRHKLNLNKNSSTTSGVDSDGLSFTSVEGENDNRKNKTILNIHIVPESVQFMSRDESLLTSVDLSLDGSPPCSTILHPLGYNRSERRKQLKREDAFQSASPPSNNSGKLSEDVDSVKEITITENKDGDSFKVEISNKITDVTEIGLETMHDDTIATMVDYFYDTALEVKSLGPLESPVKDFTERPSSLPELNSDESDVITPFTPSEEKFSNNSNLIHSGEFHEVVLPTQVSRSDTSVVRGE